MENSLLSEVHLCIVETEKRILTIVSKNKILSDVEKSLIESQYGKIIDIGNSPGSDVGVLLNIKLLSDVEKNKIVFGSETNLGKVEGLTLFKNWIINNEVVGRWRNVYEKEGKFYFC